MKIISNKIIIYNENIYVIKICLSKIKNEEEKDDDDDVCDYEKEWKIGTTEYTFRSFSHHYLLPHFLWLFKG